MDVDFLGRSDEESVRRRVQSTLTHCGTLGCCLGTGSAMANFIPRRRYP